MALEIIGPGLFECDASGHQLTRIATAFPDFEVLYTNPPGVHAWQRAAFLDIVNERRSSQNAPVLTPDEEESVSTRSVDLIVERDHVLIRPDPARMDLAFAADELLQKIISKLKIKFLLVADPRVQEAIKYRGEIWRLGGVPKTREAKEKWIIGSRVGILGLPIYYYNRLTGTRWLTHESFERLGDLPSNELAKHLQEISDNAVRRNRRNRPEVDFFLADPRRFSASDFGGVVFSKLGAEELSAKFEQLKRRFASSVHDVFKKDDLKNNSWCERMLSKLFLEGNETQTEQVISGLSQEFFMNLDWLAGGRFEEGEFLFDSVFDEAALRPQDLELKRLADPRAKEIILNFIRDYGDIEYINVGCVPESLSINRPQDEGRRGVYLADFKSSSRSVPIRRFIRLQKWGVREYLDQGKGILQAMLESDEYTDYWLNRRLGCRQLGMNMSRRVFMRRLTEVYQGTNPAWRGKSIRTTYFEREYVPGVATDKLQSERYARPGYALKFAHLLGVTAASSLIVGRTYESGKLVVFDDGDEVVREDEQGLPVEILVCDHSGAFGEYEKPLKDYAPDYARPVNRRAKDVPDPQAFALAYLDAFRTQFSHIQTDYRKRRRAFDTLFKHCADEPGAGFCFRWECVLQRLDSADLDRIVEIIRSNIEVLRDSPKAEPH